MATITAAGAVVGGAYLSAKVHVSLRDLENSPMELDKRFEWMDRRSRNFNERLDRSFERTHRAFGRMDRCLELSKDRMDMLQRSLDELRKLLVESNMALAWGVDGLCRQLGVRTAAPLALSETSTE